MKPKIATHIISGFLGTGKTTFINKLLATKPSSETWVVFVNESEASRYPEKN